MEHIEQPNKVFLLPRPKPVFLENVDWYYAEGNYCTTNKGFKTVLNNGIMLLEYVKNTNNLLEHYENLADEHK